MSRSAATFAALTVLGAALLGQLGGEPSRAAERPPVAAGDLVIDTVVGTGDPGNTGDGGPARTAGLAEPVDVATGPDGTLYVLAGHRIRAVDPRTKTITTIAGTGKSGFSGDGGPAKKATFSSRESSGYIYGARGLTVGNDGTLYVADTGNHRIRAIDPDDGTIRTVAGSGGTGVKDRHFGGDGGKATKALLYYPKDVAVDADGNLYITDSLNYRVRMVDADTGKIGTIAGYALPEEVGAFPEPAVGTKRATKTFVRPDTVAVHPSGKVYFAEAATDLVRVADPAKDTIETVAGAVTRAPEVHDPSDLAFDPEGKALYIAGYDRVYRLDLATKDVSAYAGGEKDAPVGDGRKPTDSVIAGAPMGIGIAVGPAGQLYLTDAQIYRIRMVAEAEHATRPDHRLASEPIDTLVGSGRRIPADDTGDEEEDGPFYRDVHEFDEVDLRNPGDVVVDDDGTLYLADTDNDRIRTVGLGAGVVRTLAGRPDIRPYDEEDNGDGGKATEAYLSTPRSLALGPDGRLYFADDTGDETAIRYVDLDDGTIDTMPGSRYEFVNPTGLAFDAGGDLYVVDGAADRICRLEPDADECETVVADDPDEYGEETDRLNGPVGLAIGPGGGLYVSIGPQVLRVDKRTGKITTFAGYQAGGVGVAGDGATAYSAQFGAISDLTVADGTLYLTDKANHRVRAIDLERTSSGGSREPVSSAKAAARTAPPTAAAASPATASPRAEPS
ncbi:MAG: hypothetical protein GEV07_16415 [Streptosporangiales bacterium]|nr:hypothetical protein [Streptosporangiales bacterium]